MNSYLVYRASFYVMLTLATMTLNLDPGESRPGWLFPLVVTIAGVIAFLTVDHNPRRSMPRILANVLALGTLGLLYIEYAQDETQKIRCLGHWLVYLQLIKYFLPKTAEDDWFLFLVGLMQVLIGSVINQGDQVGMWLFLWAMMAVWVLGQFFLQREARRQETRISGGSMVEAEPLGPSKVDPYRGLMDIPYAFATLRVMVLTIAMGCFFFLLLPRQAGATRNRGSTTLSKHLTGFDEEVQLGQLGEILENDSVVMTVEFTDFDRKPTRPPIEPLWRGVTLGRYEHGRWRRQSQRFSPQTLTGFPIRQFNASSRRSLIRQNIKLEANDAANLFAIRPIVEFASGPRNSPYMNPVDGSVFRPEARGAYDYEIVSDTTPNSPQFGETPPDFVRRQMLLDMPENLTNSLRKIATPLVEGLPDKGTEAVTARARAIESYLRDSGKFGYTLQMNRTDESLDPVEDFLINFKEGHCEYFASALALLLRSIEIPARVVNGFKGGDWNDMTQTMAVRQKHAHSWVEAYAGRAGDLALWITLDPTPGLERDRSVAEVGGVASHFRPFTDLIRHVWVFYIVGYDSNRQNRVFYTPIRSMVRRIREGYRLLWSWCKETFSTLFHFETISSLISLKGFFVTFIVLSLVAAGIKLLSWLAFRAFAWWRGPTDEGAGLTAGILFYRRLAQMLAEFDLVRTPAETQAEFALRATRFLVAQGTKAQTVTDVPQRVVEAFYGVRFGEKDLAQQQLLALEERLDALQTSLNSDNPP